MRRFCRSVGVLFILFSLLHGKSYSQEFIAVDDPGFHARYASFDFRERFAVRIQGDRINNYYLVDIDSFSNRFEKVWFMNLTFSEHQLVNVDPDITKSYVAFISPVVYPEKDIVKLLDDLKEKTLEKSAAMTGEQQEDWLGKNDKYRKP